MQLDLFEINKITIQEKPQFQNQYINDKKEPKLKQPKTTIAELEKIKNDFFYYELEKNYRRFQGDIETAEKMTFLDATVIKNNSIVNYSLPYKKRYNKTSLLNLNNVNDTQKKPSKSNELKKKETIKNVHKWAESFQKEYKKEFEKEFTGLHSK